MKKFRKLYEVLLIIIAIKIIHGRNVHRCTVVSRRDNNDMYYMGEKLQSICKRMMREYKDS